MEVEAEVEVTVLILLPVWVAAFAVAESVADEEVDIVAVAVVDEVSLPLSPAVSSVSSSASPSSVPSSASSGSNTNEDVGTSFCSRHTYLRSWKSAEGPGALYNSTIDVQYAPGCVTWGSTVPAAGDDSHVFEISPGPDDAEIWLWSSGASGD